MEIIIDGYNLLKSAFYEIKGSLEKQRNQIISDLEFYSLRKGHQVIIVFDGGLTRSVYKERRSQLLIVFVGMRKIADDWVYDYVKNTIPSECFLVSRDKDLVSKCGSYGVDALDPEDFYKLLQSFVRQASSNRRNDTNDDFFVANPRETNLEEIFERDSTMYAHEKEDDIYESNRSGASSRKSKLEKDIAKKINKL